MNFFYHKDLGNHLLQLRPKVVKHPVYSNKLLSENQYGFLPQSSTVDAKIAAKNFAQANLQQRNFVIMFNLDVKGAIDAAWWPSILCLSDIRCPRNLYNLTRNYINPYPANVDNMASSYQC